MSRETQRQATRLRNLAAFIQNNPKEYNQEKTNTCIVGLGVRLNRGKLGKDVHNGWNVQPLLDTFSQRYGTSDDVTKAIYRGSWHCLGIRGAKSVYDYAGNYEIRRAAVRLLNNLAAKLESKPKVKAAAAKVAASRVGQQVPFRDVKAGEKIKFGFKGSEVYTRTNVNAYSGSITFQNGNRTVTAYCEPTAENIVTIVG